MYIAIWKLSSHIRLDNWLWNSWDSPIFRIIQYLSSALPFCCRVWGQETWWELPFLVRYCFIWWDKNSPSPSDWRHLLLVENCLCTWLSKSTHVLYSSDFVRERYSQVKPVQSSTKITYYLNFPLDKTCVSSYMF